MYKKVEILNNAETQALNMPVVRRSFWNKLGWWIVKQTCKHESKRLISFYHSERLSHQQCNICGEEIWEVD